MRARTAMGASSSNQSFGNARGSCSLSRVTANVIHVVADRSLSAELGDQLAEALDKELKAGIKSHTFFDVFGLEHYDSKVRIEITRVLRDNWAKLESIHVLVRSPLVRMGVAVANLALDNRVQAYVDRASWQIEFDAARKASNLRSA